MAKKNNGKKDKITSRKPIEVNEMKKEDTEVTVYNLLPVMLKLLEATAKNTADIARLMRDVKEAK